MKHISADDLERLCCEPGCYNKRWRGQKGNNDKLTKCQKHQREEWKQAKARKRAETGPTEAEKRTLVRMSTPQPRRLVRVLTPEPQPLNVPVEVRTPSPQPPERLLVIDHINNNFTLFDVLKVRCVPEISPSAIEDMMAIFGDMRVIIAEVSVREEVQP